MKKSLSTLLLAAALTAVVSVRVMHAADLRNILEGYSLTSWGQKDGLPPSVIWAIAQDRDGYLWLATDAGPVRFDGVRFVVWQPPGSTSLPRVPVRSLFAARDGSIWLGFGEPGGVSRVRNGEVRNYSVPDGIAAGAITMLDEDPDGTVWAGNRQGLYHFVNDRWQATGDGLPKSTLYRTYVDRHGGRFVATADGLFQRGTDEATFQDVEIFDDAVRDVAEDAVGRIWVADPLVGFRRLKEPRTYSREKGRGSRLFHDSKGNLWVGTFGQGLWRVRFDAASGDPVVERTSTLNGFSDDGVTSLLEDRDGSIWAATYDGLNRLAPHKITPVMNLGVISGVEETRDGSVWVGTVDALIQFAHGQVNPRRVPQPFHGAPPSAMHADAAGTLWVATNRELLRITGGVSSPVPLPGRPLQQVSSITSDLRGGIWLTDRDQGVFRWASGRLEPVALPPELQRGQVMCSQGDRSGRVWLSFADGRVAVVSADGTANVYGERDGLTGGVYRAVYEDPDGVIWLGGNEGLSRFADGAFTTLTRAGGFPGGAVIAIIADRSGVLWLGLEGVGIVRVNRNEFSQAVRDSAYQVSSSLYDKFDGFAGAPRWFGNSSTARGEDGRLWFLSARGVSIVEPSSIGESPSSPVRVSIDGMLADGEKVSQTQLPARTTRIQIDYTVPNLASPLKTRFRYRLEGFDPDWIDAGTRRQAFYTNLPPRHYRFRVVASDVDGTWNEAHAERDFSINQRFYQTPWFMAVCGATAVLIPWVAWRLRIRKVRNQFSMLLAERARMSREIHDTVLQGLCGVSLQCDAIAHDLELSPSLVTKERVLRVRRDADDYVREARQSILNLRSPTLRGGDLATALRQAGERTIAGSPVAFTLAVRGTVLPRWTKAEEQLLRIGQEALVNAVRHADASEVRVDLHFDDTSVVLRVSDDGRGFDLDAVPQADGHCGLLTMKERAEEVGGTLRITTAIGRGVQIEAFVPITPGA